MVLIPRGTEELAVHKFQWLDFWEDTSLGCDANPEVSDFLSIMTAAVVGSACSHVFSVIVFPERCFSDRIRAITTV